MTISATTQGVKPGVCTSTNRPSAPFDGQVIYMTDVDQTAVWDGSQWTVLAPIAGGRNMVVNGDFKIWQRGTSFSSPANASFTADRWFMYYDGTGATRTISQQTFTGDQPTGLNVSNYMRVAFTVAGTGSTTNGMFSRIEDVRKLNGQTVTLSFYGKADTTRNMNWQTYQEFGTGGSSAVLANSQGFTFTSAWQRFSVSFTMPSVSGKTITSNSSISFIVTFPANATGTFDITGVQLEAGAVATPFEVEDIGTTLQKCKRYYEKMGTSGTNGGLSVCYKIYGNHYFPNIYYSVAKRSTPLVYFTSDSGGSPRDGKVRLYGDNVLYSVTLNAYSTHIKWYVSGVANTNGLADWDYIEVDAEL